MLTITFVGSLAAFLAGAGMLGWTVALQRLKGQGLGLRWFGFEAESGLGEEAVDQRGPVLDALEPVLHDGGQLAGGAAAAEVAEAVFHVRPGALDRVEVRGISRELDDGQPVRVRALATRVRVVCGPGDGGC